MAELINLVMPTLDEMIDGFDSPVFAGHYNNSIIPYSRIDTQDTWLFLGDDDDSEID